MYNHRQSHPQHRTYDVMSPFRVTSKQLPTFTRGKQEVPCHNSTFRPMPYSVMSEAERRIVKDLRTSLKEDGIYFFGQPNERVHRWLRQVEDRASAAGLQAADSILNVVHPLLREKAELWFGAVKHDIHTWSQFTDLITQEFDLPSYRQRDLARFLTQRMAIGEDGPSYYCAMRKLADSLQEPVPNPWCVIARGMSPAYLRHIDPEGITSYEDLHSKIKSIHAHIQATETFRPSEDSIVEEMMSCRLHNINSISITCYNCRGLGHYARDCPKPRGLYCSNCKSATHDTSMCDKALLDSFIATQRETHSEPPIPPEVQREITALRQEIKEYRQRISLLEANGAELKARLAQQQISSPQLIATPSTSTAGVHHITTIRPYLPVTISKQIFSALYDSGSDITLCDAKMFDFIQSCGYSLIPVSNQVVKMADGRSSEIRGSSLVPISIGSRTAKLRLHLLKGLSVPILLGTDAIQLFGLEYSPAENAVFVTQEDKSVPKEKVHLHNFLSNGNPGTCMVTLEPMELPDPIPANNKVIDHESLISDHPDLQLEQRQALQEFLTSEIEEFNKFRGKPMIAPPIKLDYDRSAKPIFQKNHFMKPEKLEILREHVKGWLAEGVIEKCDFNGWQTPIFLVPKGKGTGKFRPVLDFRRNNLLCSVSSAPLPNIGHVLANVRPSLVTSKIDLESAFNLLTLHEESRDITTFFVPQLGRFRFVRGFFGQKSIPQVFCTRIGEILAPFKTNLEVYLDDLLLHTQDMESMIQLIQEVVTVLRAHRVQINWAKSSFCNRYVTFLGVLVGQDQIQIHHETVWSVLSTPRPVTQKQLHSWLARISYFRSHYRDLGTILEPLQLMLRKKGHFKWNEETNLAWEEAREFLASPSVLSTPDWNLPFKIKVYSKEGCSIGATLIQTIDEEDKIVSHFSHVCNATQARYDAKILDCLAIVLSLERFRFFLSDKPCELISTGRGLDWLLGLKEPKRVLQRWLLRIAEFNLTNYNLQRPSDIFKPPQYIFSMPSVLELKTLLEEYVPIHESVPGKVHNCPFSIETIDCNPVVERFMALNPTQLIEASQCVDMMLREETIQQGLGSWSRPFRAILQDGKVMLHIDHRAHNQVTVPVAERSVLSLKQIIECLTNCKYMSYLNFELGENLLPINCPLSREKSAIVLEKRGLFEMLFVDNTWMNHRAFLHNFLTSILCNIEHVFIYDGKIFVCTNDMEPHVTALSNIFQILNQQDIKINLAASVFVPSEFSLFGYHFRGSGRCVRTHQEVIKAWRKPETLKEANMAAKAFNQILSVTENTPITPKSLLDEDGQTFSGIQNQLMNTLFHTPEENEEIVLACDASSKGWGAHAYTIRDGKISTIDIHGEELPAEVATGSATTIEAYAAIATIRRYRHYVRGNTTLLTDHRALVHWGRFKGHVCQGRGGDEISRTGIKVKYSQGKANVVADFLSRNPFATEEPSVALVSNVTMGTVEPKGLDDFFGKIGATNCTWYQTLKEKLEKEPQNYPDFNIDCQGRLTKWLKNQLTGCIREVLVVPSELRRQLVQAYHEEGHWGADKTFHRIAERFYWAKMKSTIKAIVKECLTCQATKKTTSDRSAGQMEYRVPSSIRPGSGWYMDYVGPLPPSQGYKYLLVAVCATTNWVYAVPTTRATAKNVINLIEKEILPVTGRTELLITDNGPAFVSKELNVYLEKRGIKQNFIPFYSPFLNKCERYNGSIKRLLRCLVQEHRKWTEALPTILFALRTYKSDVTKFSAAELFLGYNPRPWWQEEDTLVNGEAELPEKTHVESQKKLRQTMYEAALKSIQEYKLKQVEKYNKIHKKILYRSGQLVWLKSLGVKSKKIDKISAKLMPTWRGIVRVKEAYSDTQYALETLDGKDLGRYHVSVIKSANIPSYLSVEEILQHPFAGKALPPDKISTEQNTKDDNTHHYNLRPRRPAVPSNAPVL